MFYNIQSVVKKGVGHRKCPTPNYEKFSRLVANGNSFCSEAVSRVDFSDVDS